MPVNNTLDNKLMDELASIKFTYHTSTEVKISQLEGKVVLFLTSLYCVHCIDLLPHLKEVDQYAEDISLVLFTDGNKDELKDMVEYFRWTFPVISSDDPINDFTIGFKFPFMILLNEDKNVESFGTVYTKEDIIFKLNSKINTK